MGQAQPSKLLCTRSDYHISTCEPLDPELDGLVVNYEVCCRRRLVFICHRREKLVIRYRGKPNVQVSWNIPPKVSVLTWCNQKLKISCQPEIDNNNNYYDWIFLQTPTTVLNTLLRREDSNTPEHPNAYRREGNQFVALRCYSQVLEKDRPEDIDRRVKTPILVKPDNCVFSLVQLCYEQILRQADPRKNLQTISRCTVLPTPLRKIHRLRLTKHRTNEGPQQTTGTAGETSLY